MGHMQNELMLLGVATLILLTFQSEIVSYCMNAKNYTKTWLDHVSGCSCCLSRTTGVSACYLSAKGCVSNSTLAGCCQAQNERGSLPKTCANVFDESTDWETPGTNALFTVDAATGAIQPEARRRLLAAGSAAVSEVVQCYGRVQTDWPECGYRPNYRPAIGANALHQIHMFIFIIAVTHIIMGILLVSLASLKLNVWKRWKEKEDNYLHSVYEVTDKFALAYSSADSAGKLESQGDEISRPELSRSASHGGSLHPSSLPERIEILGSFSPWRRTERMRGFFSTFKETVICVLAQLNPWYLNKQTFCLMRASFALTHGIKSDSDFKFLDYLRQIMEDDFSQVVGLGLPMWIFIICFVLLSSAIGWCIWVFVCLSAAMLVVVNSKLTWIVRYVTRGGNIHMLKPGVFWGNKPEYLLPIIKFLLFFVSYVYANAIFFATQFGSKSCFFSKYGFQGQPIPWWVIMVINTCFIVSLSMFTLPLFSITVQMGGDFKGAFMSPSVQATAMHLQSMKTVRHRGFRSMIAGILPKEWSSKSKEKDESTRMIAGLPPSDLKGI